jgi:antitoxin component YwqK of YwqJK toxin-antitoxin module
MIFAFGNSIHNLEVTYDYDDTLAFIFTDDNSHKMVMEYWSIENGGHQRCITNYQNGTKHGTQYWWRLMQEGGHQWCIENFKNGQRHGTRYDWHPICWGGHQANIINYQNGTKHGIQHYWRQDGSYYTESY